MRFRDLRVRTKLLLGFGGMAAAVLAVSALALKSQAEANHRFQDYLDGIGERQQLATEVRGAAQSRAVAARNLVLVTAPADRELEKAAVLKAHEHVGVALGALRRAVEQRADATPRERELMQKLVAVEARYGVVAQQIVGLALDGKRDEAVTQMNRDCRPLLAELLAATAQFIEHDREIAKGALTAAEAAYGRDRAWLIGAGVAATLGAALLAWLLARAVTAPLVRAVSLAQAVAAGDLRSRIAIDANDETGQLLAALKQMNDSLSRIVDDVRVCADDIATASREIASGNQDLSARTEQQSSALQETASSMEQMTATVQQNAQTSHQASELASAAAGAAEQGGQVVARVVSTMGEITDASQRIADIIGTIDGIAFQTNILALNAAVEAARAGEQGRGFAVVAGEVRALAQRSATAAREIKALIGGNSEKIGLGAALVQEAGRTMGDIVERVRHVTDLAAEIKVSTAEQSSGIAQVNQAIASIDQGTQQNAALVEQSAAAAESMKQKSAQLMALIARFEIGAAHA